MRWMPPLSIETFASAVDHTLLDVTAPAARVDLLCDEAEHFGFASVCLYPRWVSRAYRRVSDRVAVCTVASFPHGLDSTAAKVESARRSLADGATEIDVVMAWQVMREGDRAAATSDVEAVVTAVHQERDDARVKVIVESSQLSREQLVMACGVVADAGADFAKTSTGFVGEGATPGVVATMRSVLPRSVRIKASGGIRSANQAVAMLNAGADRLGTSSAVAIMRELSVDAVA
jgi:deoxyribose-phosphate aldolase